MGLLRTAGRVAVASSVHGRVQRRQENRWAAQAAYSAPGPPAPVATPAPLPDANAATSSTDDMLVQLTKLGELRDAGVLTDQEFATQKARILSS